MQMLPLGAGIAQHQQRRRRVDPVPRARARSPRARQGRGRRRRAELVAGGRDGRGLERLVRQGLPRPTGLDTDTRRGEIDMGAYSVAARNSIRNAGARLPGSSARPRRPAPGRRRLHVRRLRADRAARRSTPTARSGRRRCGTCASALGSSDGASGLVTAGAAAVAARAVVPRHAQRDPAGRPGRRRRRAPRHDLGACSRRAAWATTPRPRTARTRAGRGLRAAACRADSRHARRRGRRRRDRHLPIVGATVARRRARVELLEDRRRRRPATRSATSRRRRTRRSCSTAPGYDRLVKPVTRGRDPASTSAPSCGATGRRTSGGGAPGRRRRAQGPGLRVAGGDRRRASARRGRVDRRGDKSTMVTLPGRASTSAHFGVDPGEGCVDDPAGGRARGADRDVGARAARVRWPATRTFTPADRHRMNLVPRPSRGRRPLRARRRSATQGGSAYYDMSEFGVYSLAPRSSRHPTPTPTPTATPDTARAATRRPSPTVAPTAVPTARRPRRRPCHAAPVVHALRHRQARDQGPRTCSIACAVRAELTVDARPPSGSGPLAQSARIRATHAAGTDNLHRQVELEGHRAMAVAGQVLQGHAEVCAPARSKTGREGHGQAVKRALVRARARVSGASSASPAAEGAAARRRRAQRARRAARRADVALRYVRENRAALGLDRADLDTLRPPIPRTGGRRSRPCAGARRSTGFRPPTASCAST